MKQQQDQRPLTELIYGDKWQIHRPKNCRGFKLRIDKYDRHTMV